MSLLYANDLQQSKSNYHEMQYSKGKVDKVADKIG